MGLLLAAAGASAGRCASYKSFRQRWGGWPRALRAAQITDAELLAARLTSAQRNPMLMAADTADPAASADAARTSRHSATLTPDVRRAARLDRGLSEAALRTAVRMTLSEWRRLLREPELPLEVSAVLVGMLFD